MGIGIYVKQNKKMRKLLSIVSISQTGYHFKLDFQKSTNIQESNIIILHLYLYNANLLDIHIERICWSAQYVKFDYS